MRLFLERRTTDKENQTLTPDNKKATDYLLNESRKYMIDESTSFTVSPFISLKMIS